MDSIKLVDELYGEFEINEPILIELINSKPIQRLKKIWQHGLPQKYYYRQTFTRYDHSIGVMLLLRKLNATLEEQIAGLLHDASHTAFSHVVDFLYKNKDEDYGDNILKEVLEKSNIPQIFKKYNFNFEYILDETNFLLLERKAPNLCADRIDYTLREIYQRKSKEDAIYCSNNLIVKNKEIIFKNKKSAELFAKYYFDLQLEHWGSIENMIRYELTANLLRYSAEKNIISLSDLDKDDQYILDLLLNSNDTFIKKQLDKIFKIIEYELVDLDFDLELTKKFRFVDPKFYNLKDKKINKYSDINPKYLEEVYKQKAMHEKGYKVKLLS
jgi:hypothetical protein